MKHIQNNQWRNYDKSTSSFVVIGVTGDSTGSKMANIHLDVLFVYTHQICTYLAMLI